MQINKSILGCTVCLQSSQDPTKTCQHCRDMLNSKILALEEEQKMLQSFLSSSLNEQYDSLNEGQQLRLTLRELEKEQELLSKQYEQTQAKNFKTQQSIYETLVNLHAEGQAISDSFLKTCETLQRQQIRNEKLSEEIHKLQRLKLIQSFFELVVEKQKNRWYLDGCKLTFDNLQLTLPIVRFIISNLSPLNYSKQCISQIYIDEGLIVIFETKNGKKGRDKEISTRGETSTWISYVFQELEHLSQNMNLQQKHLEKFEVSQNKKQTTFNFCANLKILIEFADSRQISK